jgi:hypothetical protein
MKDSIVEEVRQAREEHAKRFNYDLKAIFFDIRKQQEESGQRFVSFPAKRVAPSLKPTPAQTQNRT